MSHTTLTPGAALRARLLRGNRVPERGGLGSSRGVGTGGTTRGPGCREGPSLCGKAAGILQAAPISSCQKGGGCGQPRGTEGGAALIGSEGQTPGRSDVLSPLPLRPGKFEKNLPKRRHRERGERGSSYAGVPTPTPRAPRSLPFQRGPCGNRCQFGKATQGHPSPATLQTSPSSPTPRPPRLCPPPIKNKDEVE